MSVLLEGRRSTLLRRALNNRSRAHGFRENGIGESRVPRPRVLGGFLPLLAQSDRASSFEPEGRGPESLGEAQSREIQIDSSSDGKVGYIELRGSSGSMGRQTRRRLTHPPIQRTSMAVARKRADYRHCSQANLCESSLGDQFVRGYALHSLIMECLILYRNVRFPPRMGNSGRSAFGQKRPSRLIP